MSDAADSTPPPGISVPARIWGGLDASTWVKPNVQFDQPSARRVEPDPANRFVGNAVPVAGVVSLGLAVLVGLSTSPGWGAVSFLPIFLALFIGVMLAALAPKERPRQVTCSVHEGVLRLTGNGANIALFFERIASFRAATGARPGTTVLALRLTEGDVIYIEMDSRDAMSIVELLDASVASTVGQTGMRPTLGRHSRPLAEWRESLRGLVAQEGYRGGRPNVERLLAAVRDDKLGAEERIGAALAIAGRPDAESRDKLRIAAREAPTEALRVALERVAEDTVEEAQIEEAVKAEDRRWRV